MPPPSGGMASRAFTARFSERDFELVGVDPHRPQARRKVGGHPDPAAERAAQQLCHAEQAGVEVEGLGPERLLAGEGEQAAGQLLGVLRRLDHAVEHDRAPALVQPRRLEELRAGGDDLEDVVEVVRDAAGELADGLQLLALARGLLGAAALLRFAQEGRGALLH